MTGLERTARRQVGRWLVVAVTCVGLLAACGPEEPVAAIDGGEETPNASVRATPDRLGKPPEWAPVLREAPAVPRTDAQAPGIPPQWEG